MNNLADLVRDAARDAPRAIALRAPEGEWTYHELDRQAELLASALSSGGVGRGDRVAVWLPKSLQAVAAMQAALRLGASYVPIDPFSPKDRVRRLLTDCEPAGVVTFRRWADATLVGELEDMPALAVDDPPDGWPDAGNAQTALPLRHNQPDDLAYILYTSGSTGEPKGVCISHRNALSFIEWAQSELGTGAGDRFASHAPFHFDLSVLDLYVAFASRATVCLIPDASAYVGPKLVEFLLSERVTVWYSVPSALVLMMRHGGLQLFPQTRLRVVLFAGEPFPIKQLQRLRRALPAARLLNLYGPTETNVCTFHEVDDLAEDRTSPVPIGSACSGDTVWAERDDGSEAEVGEKGELVVAGPTVMQGYWGRPHQRGPYRTGDIVRRLHGDDYEYVGRRDAMVKLRGNRVELGEIDSALLAHDSVCEVATVVAGSGIDARLVAFARFEGEPPTLLEMKRHCAERLPRHMIIAELRSVDEVPRTRNGKLDRRALVARCPEPVAA